MKKILNFWFGLSDKIRFLFVGGFNFACSYVIFVLTTFILGAELYQVCNALAWVISSAISFTTQRFLVFRTKGNWIKQYLKCCTTWVIGYLINAFLLELFVKLLNWNIYLSQIIAVGLTSIVTYILFKYFAFKRRCVVSN